MICTNNRNNHIHYRWFANSNNNIQKFQKLMQSNIQSNEHWNQKQSKYNNLYLYWTNSEQSNKLFNQFTTILLIITVLLFFHILLAIVCMIYHTYIFWFCAVLSLSPNYFSYNFWMVFHRWLGQIFKLILFFVLGYIF